MAGKKFDGNGTKIKGAADFTAGINSIGVPGWSKTEIDDSDLSNVDVMTAILATLKKYNAATFNIDFAAAGQLASEEGNQEWTITFPKSKGTLTFWGQIQAVADSSFVNNESPTRDVTITLTNLNATGVETKPVLTISEGGK